MDNKIDIDLLEKLVRIRSLSKNHDQCLLALEVVKEKLDSQQVPCFVDSNNDFPFLIAGDGKLADTLILCHIDIVPASDEQFTIRVDKNKICGRGVLDMKGPLVAALESFLHLWKIGRRQFLFAVTSDEEIGGFNGTSTFTGTVFKNIKNAIIPDSTGDDLVLIQKAPFHIKLNSTGKSCHGSKPWEGINAADKLLGCCNEIIKLINHNSPDLTSACLSQFHSGDATNKVPDNAMATIDIRIREEKEVGEVVKIINQSSFKWDCSWEKIDEPMFFEAKIGDLFLKKWVLAFTTVNGRKPNTKVESGASDARFLWNDLKIPVIVTSVMGGGAHSDYEWADLESLNWLSKTIINFGLEQL